MRTKTERTTQEQLQATGGGPPIKGITEFEEQAITIFGVAAVDGLPGVGTLGHQVLPPLYINTEPVSAQAPASSQTITSPALSINFSSSPSPPDLSSSSLSPSILPSPMSSPTYIPSEGKLTAAKMLGAVLKKMEDHEKREEEAIALQKKIVEQNEQMTAVLNQMSQALTSMSEVMVKLCEKLNNNNNTKI
ncbi:uncharacterized protein LOC109579223 [Bactrocera dorsalis]|uniref:Uncharacterized protein LOC109579223 n=1 Tax=Bactrocera dorsalis TaxID=27457 RepID=A0A6J0RIM9_BACDO|nr:uncharacterized protein LOC109579223 [Bactrocera dorsalis]